MPTSSIKTPEWREPQQGENAGIGSWNRPNSPYDNFMESEGMPIYRGIGVHRVQDLPLRAWKRLGGQGTFIQLYGTEGLWGCYVVESSRRRRPQAPNITCMKKFILVVEGRGTTEVWVDGAAQKASIRVADRLAVLHSHERLAPGHQCALDPARCYWRQPPRRT